MRRSAQRYVQPDLLAVGMSDDAIAALSDDALLATFQAIGRAVGERLHNSKPVLSSWSVVIDYLRSAMAFQPIESFRVLFLDKRNRLIADEEMQRGTVDHTPVYPREVLKRAIELNSTAVVLAHNHPSGDPSPSQADIHMTKQIKSALDVLGISLHDHVIVGRDGHASLRGLNLI